MAQQKTKVKSKKKPNSKPKTRPAKSASARSTQKPSGKSTNPIAVIVIMGLVTALALMVNKFVLQHNTDHKPADKETTAPRRAADDIRKEDRSDREVKHKTEKQEKPDKPAKPRKKDEDDSSTVPKEAIKPLQEDVKVYFVKLDEKTEKIFLAPVSRKVGKNGLMENTMKELIKGPSTAEKKKGLLSAVPQGLKVNSVKLKNNAAHIDFNGAIDQGANGSVLINRIDQIVYTATQFPGVKSVIITIDGKPRQTLGPDGLSIGGPLHRRR